MNHGLSHKTVQKIKGVLAKYEQVDSAILYGSRATGNYRNGSDIDLALKGSDCNLKLLAKICNEIDDLLLPYKLDISIYKNIDNKDLIEHINNIGVDFYQKPPTL